ncbi:type II toxin-antitoxin system ParD family antitoxin [Pseudomonas sp. MWU13-2105]|uniref:ribbon-helix-helix domain-containing protein n=1 Tax=Pseudomonas sp. MWU13-2105 TaxID=2935074 RepID=UPI00298CC881|nr:type II toxin-antitoxin system ParD family antitoxin [Pseudomonas sp. MWU13-2105]
MARTVYPPTGDVVLTDHSDPVISDLVVSGQYPNASQIMREGLRLLEPHEAEERARLEALRQTTSAGLMDLEGGRFIEMGSEPLGEFLADIGERAALSVTRNR